MSDPQVPQEDPVSADSGAKCSRRQIRQAERQAEREAALTGVQPVLTRRELRRLREEAAALQAAVQSGEITLDQAKALQDPLAAQPNIDVPRLDVTGVHAAVTGQQRQVEPQNQPELDSVTKEKLSQLDTGLLMPVDMPLSTPAQAAPPAPHTALPPRRSVLHAPEVTAPEPALPEAPAPSPIAAEDDPTTGSTPLASSAAVAPVMSPETVSARRESSVAAPNVAEPATPTRRPIVRIPAAAGVRTVDPSTGELSAVQPLDEDFAAVETPRWKALHASSAAPEKLESAVSVSAATPAPPDIDLTRVASTQGSPNPWLRYLLIALFVLVVVLVIVVLLWFMADSNSTAASAAFNKIGAGLI